VEGRRRLEQLQAVRPGAAAQPAACDQGRGGGPLLAALALTPAQLAARPDVRPISDEDEAVPAIDPGSSQFARIIAEDVRDRGERGG
jgi:hypothetical protein